MRRWDGRIKIEINIDFQRTNITNEEQQVDVLCQEQTWYISIIQTQGEFRKVGEKQDDAQEIDDSR